MKTTNPKPDTHSTLRTEIVPGQPDKFKAQCGYESENGKEFTIAGKVTCVLCLGLTVGYCTCTLGDGPAANPNGICGICRKPRQPDPDEIESQLTNLGK